MRVVVADLDAPEASKVADEIATAGGEALAVACDVTDPASVEALAEQAYQRFAEVNLLINNAGVIKFSRLHQLTLDDWDWMLSVNLRGVINGVQAFLPRLREQEGEAHIVNTGSIAGLVAGLDPGTVPYSASKFAVVGLSEAMRPELERDEIGVTVVCPHFTNTRILDAARNRPERYGGPEKGPLAEFTSDEAMDPAEVAWLVLEAVRNNELYVMTHMVTLPFVEKRCAELRSAYDRLEERLKRA